MHAICSRNFIWSVISRYAAFGVSFLDTYTAFGVSFLYTYAMHAICSRNCIWSVISRYIRNREIPRSNRVHNVAVMTLQMKFRMYRVSFLHLECHYCHIRSVISAFGVPLLPHHAHDLTSEFHDYENPLIKPRLYKTKHVLGKNIYRCGK